MTEPKILFMDLENVQHMQHIFHPGNLARKRAAGFCTDLAYILVFGYKWLGQPAQYILPDMKQFKRIPHDINEIDKTLCAKALEIMHEADMVITWYGSGHDWGFLTGRSIKHGMVLAPNIIHLDLYKVASKQMNVSSNRLDNIAKILGCEMKTKVSNILWPRCWMGDKEALLEMGSYCKQDVNVLEQVYLKMRPLIKNHPHIGAISHGDKSLCRTCGSGRYRENGTYALTSGTLYKRLKCLDCQASFKGWRIDK